VKFAESDAERWNQEEVMKWLPVKRTFNQEDMIHTSEPDTVFNEN
jgi:hypothetical protein